MLPASCAVKEHYNESGMGLVSRALELGGLLWVLLHEMGGGGCNAPVMQYHKDKQV